MLRQLLTTHFSTDCLSIQFLVYTPPHPHPLFPSQLVRPTLITYFSLCSTCVIYGTPCHIIGNQPLPTQPCYRKYYVSEGVFFTLRYFLPCTPSCFFKSSLGPAVQPESQQSFKLIFEPLSRLGYLFESQQSTKDLDVVGFI